MLYNFLRRSTIDTHIHTQMEPHYNHQNIGPNDHPALVWLWWCHSQISLETLAEIIWTLFTILPYDLQEMPHSKPTTVPSSLNWTSSFTRRKINWLLLIYKPLLDLSPPNFSQLLHISSPVFNTRSAKLVLLTVPKSYSSLGSLSFQPAAPRDWNNLQETLKLDTFISF